MSKRPNNDPFKSPPMGSGFPPGTSGNRENIQPTGSYEDASNGPNNGRALIKNMGTTGSVRVQNGGIYSLGGAENLTGTGNNGFVTCIQTLLSPANLPPVDNFFDCKGGTSFLLQEYSPNAYNPAVGPIYLTATFYLNQSDKVSDEIALNGLNTPGIIRGVNYPIPPASSSDSYTTRAGALSNITNALLRLNFDRISIRAYGAIGGNVAVRAIYTTGEAAIFPLSSAYNGA
jgi:hypothetical protein